MPTNDVRLAVQALESLRESGTNLALLRAPIDVGTERHASDVDVVVDTQPDDALARALLNLQAKGIHVVAVWPYDIGGTATVFVFDENALRGAQLDLLYDPAGIGHYSVRSSALLAGVSTDRPIPTVDPDRLLVYEVSKRHRKRQTRRLQAALQALGELPAHTRRLLVEEIVTSRSLARLILGSDGDIETPDRLRRLVSRSERLAKRLAKPVGFWVHATGKEIAAGVNDRFGSVLIRAAASPVPSSPARFPFWYAKIVAPIRWRPGLVVSWGPLPPIHPDLILSPELSVDDAAREIVAAMEQRLF